MKQHAWNGLLRPQGKFKCAGRNCLAREEISTFALKKVHIGTFIGQFITLLGMIGQLFRFCELAFRFKSDHWNERRKIGIAFGFRWKLRLRERYCQEKFERQAPWRVKKRTSFIKKAA
jgi:hypothetical protein